MKNKILGFGVVLVVIIGLFVALTFKAQAPDSQAPAAGGDVRNVGDEFPNGLSIGNVNVNWVKGQMTAGQNQAFWKNTTGRTVFVDLAEMETTGTASSTYQFFVATSTTATLSSDFTDPFSTLIDAFTLATSTTQRVINNIKDGGTNGRGVLRVTDGQYVVLTFQQTYNNACTGSVCETATSTNRGFNVNWLLRYNFY